MLWDSLIFFFLIEISGTAKQVPYHLASRLIYFILIQMDLYFSKVTNTFLKCQMLVELGFTLSFKSPGRTTELCLLGA